MPEISPALYRAGDGEPLVLVHGFTATWRCWLPVLGRARPALRGHRADAARPRRRAAAARRRRTRSPTRPTTSSRCSTSSASTTAHFAGNSMGGALSLELAKRGRARSVVAISPGGGWAEDDRARGRADHPAVHAQPEARARDRAAARRRAHAPAAACAGSRCATS